MLTLYNSLSRKKESFTPKVNKDVSLYICGITPYDTTHLGHAFTYISFDVLVRFLSFQGYKVSYTQNVTDINDRDNDILKRAKEQDIPWQKLATFWTKKFLLDMESLNWIKPTAF
jgi:L-cysteine:1D-myo-inositol 2-amino-2-deoxy-alpha-D-glucopyranoside ligase